jgi:hypothetical protein
MAIPQTELRYILEEYLYSGNTVNVALINDALQLGIPVTVVAATDVFTTATPHLLVSGSRLRLGVAAGGGNFIPGGVNDTIDYYVNKMTATTFRLTTTLARALAPGPFVDVSSAGQGVVFNEQTLNTTDPIAVLINHELPAANGYLRASVTLGDANIVGAEAVKAGTPFFIAPIGGPIVYRHILLIRGGSDTIGSAFGDVADLTTETLPVTIADGSLRAIAIQLFAQQG